MYVLVRKTGHRYSASDPHQPDSMFRR